MDCYAEADGEVVRCFAFLVNNIERVSRNDEVAGENRVQRINDLQPAFAQVAESHSHKSFLFNTRDFLLLIRIVYANQE